MRSVLSAILGLAIAPNVKQQQYYCGTDPRMTTIVDTYSLAVFAPWKFVEACGSKWKVVEKWEHMEVHGKSQ